MDQLKSPTPTNLVHRQCSILRAWISWLLMGRTGKLEKEPHFFRSLQTSKPQKDLKLHWWRLEEDLLPHVAALTHLGRLSPTNAHVGNQLCFSKGFPKDS